MATKAIDIAGKRFGRLLVIKRRPPSGKFREHVYWDCICSCGKNLSVTSYNLRHGRSTSCGCDRNYVHGLTKKPTYFTLRRIIGASKKGGWEISAEFEDVAKFYAYVGDRPDAGYRLHRIDSTKGYIKGNLIWQACKYTGRLDVKIG